MYTERSSSSSYSSLSGSGNQDFEGSRSHTITALIIVFTLVSYCSFYIDVLFPGVDRIWAGLIGSLTMFVTWAVVQGPDGCFRRPSKWFWRLMLSYSLLWLLAMVFAVFQEIETLRKIVAYLDPEVVVPIPESSYAVSCDLFLPDDHPKGRYGNLWGSFDFFVVAHLLGWIVKAVVLRDWWLLWVCSITFELCEISLRHILPNFWECWWDHLLLDVFGCNLLGMVLGFLFIKIFDLRRYDNWRVCHDRESLRATKKLRGPSAALSSIGSWTMWWMLTCAVLLFDLNFFFLKAIFWLRPTHPIILSRSVMLGSAAIHGAAQLYEWAINPSDNRIGVQCWLVLASLCAEALVITKFYGEIIEHVVVPWYAKVIPMTGVGVVLVGYVITFMRRLVRGYTKRKRD